jgi:hypothetical protein
MGGTGVLRGRKQRKGERQREKELSEGERQRELDR